MVNSKSPGSGETIGSIDETEAKPKNDQEEKPKPPETLSHFVYAHQNDRFIAIIFIADRNEAT